MHPDGMAASGLGNPLAAMPSMHFGWALAAGYAFLRWAENPVLRAAGLLHPLVMGVAIVVTGNHYLLDAVASALLLAAASLVGPRLEVGWIAGDEPEVDPEPASPIVGSLTSTRRPSGRGDR